MKKRILTGDRPTGPLHLGHYVGSLANRVRLQHEYDTYILLADVQALTDNLEQPEKVRDERARGGAGLPGGGARPEDRHDRRAVAGAGDRRADGVLLQPGHRGAPGAQPDDEGRDPSQKGMEDNVTYGFLGYPVSQAADITFVKAHLVPVGEDQTAA